jgi:hypothetical protein
MAGDSFLPFIDGFGQFAHRDWPGKIHTDQDLTSQRSVEAATLVARPGPDQRSTYGGWTAGPRFEATGFFRVVQHAGVWWFVDPEGYLFWSHGIDCVASRYGATGVTEREGYFADLPELDHVMARFYGTGNWAPHGFYKDRMPYRTYHHRGANLWRKYGDQWPEEFADVSHRRLVSWGMNTIGNWSDRELYLQRRTPYVATAWLDAPPPRRVRSVTGANFTMSSTPVSETQASVCPTVPTNR